VGPHRKEDCSAHPVALVQEQDYLVLGNGVMDTDVVIEGWLNVAEAVERLGISVQRVQRLKAGALDGRKGPGGWIVVENADRVSSLLSRDEPPQHLTARRDQSPV
jgi:hypothetical protein